MKIIIKLSGKIIDDDVLFEKFIYSVKKQINRNKLIIIHGGGVQVSEWMRKLSIEPKFVNGLRVTDENVLDIVISVLCGLINKKMVFAFFKNNIKKIIGLSCIDGGLLITDINEELGYVGTKIKKVNTTIIDYLLNKNYVVLISSVGIGFKNNIPHIANINADDVTYSLAEKIKPKRIFFLTDKEGVLDNNGKVIKKLRIRDIDVLIKESVIKEGMLPKLNAVKRIFKKGIKEIYISNNLEKLGTKIIA
ncbi:MAG: acetylglutamate kinase [Endomicrobia bacterium]|nr:acetylglutamate kinase [Endomicrobiia bacterium]